MSVADAVDAPRLLYGRTWGAPSLSVKVEDRFDPACIAALGRLGHEIEELGGPYIDSLGHAGMLVRHAAQRADRGDARSALGRRRAGALRRHPRSAGTTVSAACDGGAPDLIPA